MEYSFAFTQKSDDFLAFVSEQRKKQSDQNQALSSIFREMLYFFDCERSWCLYPCDPNSKFWGVPIEQTRYEWPGVKHVELDMPTVDDDIAAFNLFLSAKGPVTFGKNADHPVPDHVQKVFGVKSQISTVVYPRRNHPWVLGIHYCEKEHRFHQQEIAFFDLLGKRFAELFDELAF